MDGEVAKLGATRRTRYALRRQVAGQGPRFELFRIRDRGQGSGWAVLEAFHHTWRVEWASARPAWADHFADPEGLWRQLPFFLSDLRPRGYLGRSIAAAISDDTGFPSDPVDWDDDTLLTYLIRFGDDLPGDLVVGEDRLRNALSRSESPPGDTLLAPDEAPHRYPSMAERAASDPPTGSPVGGGQPKFLASISHPGGTLPVIVKFSAPVNQAAGRRWADLLVMECHALILLADAGLAGPAPRIIDGGGRRFLEIPRFDRTPGGGRAGVVSLAALHRAAIGPGAEEGAAMTSDLAGLGLMPQEDIATARRLRAFGEMIGNHPMRGHDVPLLMGDDGFRLAPACDMLPMIWAPGPQGELPDPRFAPDFPGPGSQETWLEMLPLAREFWDRVVSDPRISREFIATARAAGEVLARLSESRG